MNFSDLTGMEFGRLIAKEYLGGSKWFCWCICGNWVEVGTYSLKSGNSTSCGCKGVERAARLKYKHGFGAVGKRRHYAYHVWVAMRQRCSNPRNHAYSNYGGRGIRVCERWNDFGNFIQDMGDRPLNTSIERLDNNGDYCPDNCVWADIFKQANNTRSNHYVRVGNRVQTVAQWSREMGISSTVIINRLKCGWSEERSILTPNLKLKI